MISLIKRCCVLSTRYTYTLSRSISSTSTNPTVQRNLLCGIDESGRGSIVGPLIVTLCSLTSEQYDTLKYDKTIRDSKLTSIIQRNTIISKIQYNNIQYNNISYSADTIDKLRTVEKLTINDIETDMFIKSIESFQLIDQIHTIYVDGFTHDNTALCNKLTKHFDNQIKFVVEHKADSLYLPVSAASIIAKHTRDQYIARLQQQYNARYKSAPDQLSIGSGYPADTITQKWINTVLSNKLYFTTQLQYIRHSYRRGAWNQENTTLVPPPSIRSRIPPVPNRRANTQLPPQPRPRIPPPLPRNWDDKINRVHCRNNNISTYHTTAYRHRTSDDFVMIESADMINDLSQPLILRGAAEHWKLKSMTFDEIGELDSEAVVPCELSVNGGDYRDIDNDESNQSYQHIFESDVDIELIDLIDHINEQSIKTTNNKIYLAQKDITDTCPNLSKLIQKQLPVYISPELDTPSESDIQQRIWMGPKGVYCSDSC